MSIVVSALSRLTTTALYLSRLAVHRLGLGPVVLAVTAAAALLYSWRARRDNPPQQAQHPARRRRRRSQQDVRASRSDVDASEGVGDLEEAGGKPEWLKKVRKVSLGAKWKGGDGQGAVFCEGEGGGAVVRDDVASSLKHVAKLFDLHFITEVESNEAEDEITNALREAGMFEPGLLDARKVLFCETDLGRVSIARQIDPQLHVDESATVVSGLQRFVPFVALVGGSKKSAAAPAGSNVAKFTSLAHMFT